MKGNIRYIRKLLLFFMVALFLSGLTAIPINIELSWLLHIIPKHSLLHQWLGSILGGYQQTKSTYPYLLYGYDWLAFAHFVLAILFIGPYQNPVQNIWVMEFGLIACLLVIPFAFIAGQLRSIPIWWRTVDCSFGLVGFVILICCYRKTKELIALTHTTKKYIYETV